MAARNRIFSEISRVAVGRGEFQSHEGTKRRRTTKNQKNCFVRPRSVVPFVALLFCCGALHSKAPAAQRTVAASRSKMPT